MLLRAGYPYKFAFCEPYLLLKNNDDWTHNMFEIHRILAMDRNEYDEVYLYIGGSGALESISWDGQIENIIKRDAKKKVRFVSLCSSYKTVSDEIKIINALAGSNVTFLISTEAWRFKVPADIQLEYSDPEGRYVKKYFHLGMPSMSLDFLAENKTSIGYKQLLRLPHSAAYFGELLKKRLPEFVTTGKLKKRRHDRHDVSRRENKPYSPERVNGAIGFLGKSANNFTQHSDLNFQLLEQAVMLAHSHGNRTILVELPVNGAVAKGFAAFAPDYDTRIRTLAQKHGIEYFEFSKDGPWKNQYYRDHHHMIKAGWKKFTPLLAERLVQDLIETEKYSMSDN